MLIHEFLQNSRVVGHHAINLMTELFVNLQEVFTGIDAPDDNSVSSAFQVPEESLRDEMDETNDVDAAPDHATSLAASFKHSSNHGL
jgi:hypothetical protein